MFSQDSANGKKTDVNGGIKVPVEYRENRLAALAEFYANNEWESPFDSDGLAIESPNIGPQWAEPVNDTSDTLDDTSDGFFTVNRTKAWNEPFDPSRV